VSLPSANKENAQNSILKIAMAIPVSQIPALLFIYCIFESSLKTNKTKKVSFEHIFTFFN